MTVNPLEGYETAWLQMLWQLKQLAPVLFGASMVFPGLIFIAGKNRLLRLLGVVMTAAAAYSLAFMLGAPLPNIFGGLEWTRIR